MKILLAMLLGLGSLSAFADCSVEIDLSTSIDGGASPQYYPPAHLHQIMQLNAKQEITKILMKKGYDVVEANGAYKLYLSYNYGKSSRFDLALGERVTYRTVNRYIAFWGQNFEKLLEEDKSVQMLSEKKDEGLKNRKKSLSWLIRKTAKVPHCN